MTHPSAGVHSNARWARGGARPGGWARQNQVLALSRGCCSPKDTPSGTGPMRRCPQGGEGGAAGQLTPEAAGPVWWLHSI